MVAAVYAIDYDQDTDTVQYNIAVGDQGTHEKLMKHVSGESDRYFPLPIEAAYARGAVNGTWCRYDQGMNDLGVVYGTKGELRDTELSPDQTREL